VEPDKILNVRKTLTNTHVLRVHLDNEQYVDCTPDHRFMLRDGSYKEAKDLIQGESLMPLYNKYYKRDHYKEVYDPSLGDYAIEHKLVVEQKIGRKLFSNEVTHHKDFDGCNNEPCNLVEMDYKKHIVMHSTLMKQAWATPVYREKTIQGILKSAKKVGEHSKELWKTTSYREKVLRKVRSTMASQEYRAKRSKISKEVNSRSDYRAKRAKTLSSPEYLKKAAEVSKELWKDVKYRNKTVEAQRIATRTPEGHQRLSHVAHKKWSNPTYKSLMLSVLEENHRNNTGNPVVAQKIRESYKEHTKECICTACRSKRGDRPPHKEDCTCCICRVFKRNC